VDYLCKYFGYSLKEALSLFETARGHEIENEVLRAELIKRHGTSEGIEITEEGC